MKIREDINCPHRGEFPIRGKFRCIYRLRIRMALYGHKKRGMFEDICHLVKKDMGTGIDIRLSNGEE